MMPLLSAFYNKINKQFDAKKKYDKKSKSSKTPRFYALPQSGLPHMK
jgi:hypothetical protein